MINFKNLLQRTPALVLLYILALPYLSMCQNISCENSTIDSVIYHYSTHNNRGGHCNNNFDGKYLIPIVIHVIEPFGQSYNLTDASIEAQIDLLNDQFRKVGVSSTLYPGIAADTEIEFRLAKSDTNGFPHSGVNRVNWLGAPFSNTYFDNTIKPSTIWNPDKYFNIWIADFLHNGVARAGYSTFPLNSGLPGEIWMSPFGSYQNDGVVVNYWVINSVNENTWVAHEIGHFLGLFHTMFGSVSPGDNVGPLTNCSLSDFCDDTPFTRGHQDVPCDDYYTCGTIIFSDRDMIENFMDYTNECHQIFTEDQKIRMHTTLNNAVRRPTHLNAIESFDTYEPNFWFQNPRRIFPLLSSTPVDSTISSYINSTLDYDWFQIFVDRPGTLVLTLNDLENNYDLELYGSGTSTYIDGSFNSSTNDEQITYSYTLSSQTDLFINVHGVNNDYSLCDDYDLRLQWTPSAGGCSPVTLSTSSTDESLQGALDGLATVTVNTGTPPYTYSWQDGQTTATAVGLGSGTYSVTVTGADGCSASSSVYVGIQGLQNPYCNGQRSYTGTYGTFSDGSDTSFYANNSSCSWLIFPSSNISTINLSFSSFAVDTTDFVVVYDGDNNGANPIDTFTGNTLPPTVTSTGDKMYLEFITNSYDTAQGWSANYTTNILPTGTSLRAYEYWFDDDYGNRNYFNISPQPVLNLNTSVPTTGLDPGLHRIHIRFKDEHGNYSSVISQFFQKLPEFSTNSKRLVVYEYWFDNDYASKVSETINLQPSTLVVDNINTSNLSQGVHSYHIRFLDNSGLWSSVVSQFIHKVGYSVGIPNLITSYRYWFNQGDSSMITVNLPTPTNPYQLLTDIDATNLINGQHTVHFQFKDTIQLWSSVITDTFQKAIFPIALFDTVSTFACDSGIVNFTNNSINANRFYWDFGDGATSTLYQPSHLYSSAGVYTVQLVATDTITGLSDTLSSNNLVNISTSSALSIQNITACNSYISPSGNYNWTTSGTYMDTLANFGGCDSVIQVNLTINSFTPSNVVDDAYLGCSHSCDWLTTNLQGGYSYLWSTGATSRQVNVCPNLTSIYYVTVTENSSGCSFIDSSFAIVSDSICAPGMVRICRIRNRSSRFEDCVDTSQLAIYLSQGATLGCCGNGPGVYHGPPPGVGPGSNLRGSLLSQVYPNPFTLKTIVEFSLSQPGYITVEIFNAIGQRVDMIYADNVEENKVYQAAFVRGDLPTGIYIAKVTSDIREVNYHKLFICD